MYVYTLYPHLIYTAYYSHPSFYYQYIPFVIDHTTNQGKGSIKERNESAFAVAIDALTYQSPVTRGAGGSRK